MDCQNICSNFLSTLVCCVGQVQRSSGLNRGSEQNYGSTTDTCANGSSSAAIRLYSTLGYPKISTKHNNYNLLLIKFLDFKKYAVVAGPVSRCYISLYVHAQWTAYNQLHLSWHFDVRDVTSAKGYLHTISLK
jgi:hypothetical protein